MTGSTIEQAYRLARSGTIMDLPTLRLHLKANGCRSVDALLAPRAIQAHLQAICTAAVNAKAAA